MDIIFVNVNSNEIEILGSLDEMLTGTNFHVTPFVGMITNKYELKLNNIINVDKKNFKSLKGDFSLSKNGKFLYNIYPEKRYYYVTKIITTEAGIYHHPLQDFYLVMGEQKNNKITIKFFQNPLVSLIWLGGLIIFLSGTLTLRKK